MEKFCSDWSVINYMRLSLFFIPKLFSTLWAFLHFLYMFSHFPISCSLLLLFDLKVTWRKLWFSPQDCVALTVLVPVYVINALVAGYSRGAQRDNVVLQHNKLSVVCSLSRTGVQGHLTWWKPCVSSSYMCVWVYMYPCMERRMCWYHEL